MCELVFLLNFFVFAPVLDDLATSLDVVVPKGAEGNFFGKKEVCAVAILKISRIFKIGFPHTKDIYISCHFVFVCVLPPVVL